MNAEIVQAFDAMASDCEVGARLCELACSAEFGIGLTTKTLCIRLGLALSRAGQVESALSSGQSVGLFSKSNNGDWKCLNINLARELGPILLGAHFYRSRVHADEDIVEVVLTKPSAPSRMSEQLDSTLQGDWSLRDTRQLLPAIAESATLSFSVMTPYFDEKGADIVVNLFNRARVPKKSLILRLDSEGNVPSGYAAAHAELLRIGVNAYNFRIDRGVIGVGNETFHAKVVLADDLGAYVGSSNMNRWSFEYSLELGLFVRGAAARRIADIVESVRRVSVPMV